MQLLNVSVIFEFHFSLFSLSLDGTRIGILLDLDFLSSLIKIQNNFSATEFWSDPTTLGDTARSCYNEQEQPRSIPCLCSFTGWNH